MQSVYRNVYIVEIVGLLMREAKLSNTMGLNLKFLSDMSPESIGGQEKAYYIAPYPKKKKKKTKNAFYIKLKMHTIIIHGKSPKHSAVPRKRMMYELFSVYTHT